MANISHMWNRTVSTYRKTTSPDSGGSPVSVITEEIAALSCRLQQATGQEIVKGGGKFAEVSYFLYTDSTADLLMKDAILIEGVFYEVVDKKIEGNEDLYMKVLLEKRKE